MPFGAGFVVAFVVLPAFLGCDVEDNVLAVVLSGFGFSFCPRRPMRITLLNMVFGSVSFPEVTNPRNWKRRMDMTRIGVSRRKALEAGACALAGAADSW